MGNNNGRKSVTDSSPLEDGMRCFGYEQCRFCQAWIKSGFLRKSDAYGYVCSDCAKIPGIISGVDAPPLTGGGQGRSAHDIDEYALGLLVLAGVAIVSLLALLIAAWFLH